MMDEIKRRLRTRNWGRAKAGKPTKKEEESSRYRIKSCPGLSSESAVSKPAYSSTMGYQQS